MLATIAVAFAKLQIVAMNVPIAEIPKVLSYGPLEPGFSFNRAAVSWNVEGVDHSRVLVEARTGPGAWKPIERWSAEAKGSEDVKARAATRLFLRMTLSAVPRATLRMVTVAFERDRPETAVRPNKGGSMSALEVDLSRVTGGTPENRLLSAYISHWARTLGRPDLRRSADELSKAHGPHPGLGLLAATAGSPIGLRAYVSYFGSPQDVVAWTELAPVWCSLKIDGSSAGALVEGLTSNGDVQAVIPTDKGLRRTKIGQRAFAREWSATGRQVMIIQPKGLDTPEGLTDSPVWIHLHHEPPFRPSPGHKPPNPTIGRRSSSEPMARNLYQHCP